MTILNLSINNLSLYIYKKNLDADSFLNVDELLCECNEPECDREFVDILGLNYTGVCRPLKGGKCRKAVEIDKNRTVKDFILSYDFLIKV